MDINRSRPPKDGDVALWLSGLVNDAFRDAEDAGLPTRECIRIVTYLAESRSPTYQRPPTCTCDNADWRENALQDRAVKAENALRALGQNVSQPLTAHDPLTCVCCQEAAGGLAAGRRATCPSST